MSYQIFYCHHIEDGKKRTIQIDPYRYRRELDTSGPETYTMFYEYGVGRKWPDFIWRGDWNKAFETMRKGSHLGMTNQYGDITPIHRS